jgi:sugar phosphate isomerase/epimerase
MSELPDLDGRLGLDQPSGRWPAPARLKAYEAAGFSHLQVRTPPRSLLCDAALSSVHAEALRDNVALTGLRLILHAPDDLLAGTRAHDRALEGALRYAATAGARTLVYHGARVDPDGPRVKERLAAEERSLRRALRVAAELQVVIAVENLAPVYPGERYASHRLQTVLDLVQRLGSGHVGLCLDLGHAHIAAGLGDRSLPELIEPSLPHVVVFHVHDNFGADPSAERAGGVEPVKLDLHLPPGVGNLPWPTIADQLRAHGAPLQLEIHPGQRPEPAALAILLREALVTRRARTASAR